MIIYYIINLTLQKTHFVQILYESPKAVVGRTLTNIFPANNINEIFFKFRTMTQQIDCSF